jgi:hypothetical protein
MKRPDFGDALKQANIFFQALMVSCILQQLKLPPNVEARQRCWLRSVLDF